MSHTEAVFETVHVMTDTNNAGQRSYAAVLAELLANPDTTYRLRALIQDDDLLRQASVPDRARLERLDLLVAEDKAVAGLRSVPPMKAPHTAQQRAAAAREVNAVNALEGYEPTPEYLALQAKVVSGELSFDGAVQEAIARAKARGAGAS